MNEVEEICTRVAIIRDGRILFDGATDELIERGARPWIRLATSDQTRATQLVRGGRWAEHEAWRGRRAAAHRRAARDSTN